MQSKPNGDDGPAGPDSLAANLQALADWLSGHADSLERTAETTTTLILASVDALQQRKSEAWDIADAARALAERHHGR